MRGTVLAASLEKLSCRDSAEMLRQTILSSDAEVCGAVWSTTAKRQD